MAQAQELIESLGSSPYPVAVMGDLNTEAPHGATYGLFVDAGFIDLWDRNLIPHSSPGWTCCHPGSLVGTSRVPFKRIDLILFRSTNTRHGNDGIGSAFVEVIGEEPSDLTTPTGLWASDHDGVVASIRVPK
jgi:endonuclease/exonuclease/phosphatase family metal-dependent hydrolase